MKKLAIALLVSLFCLTGQALAFSMANNVPAVSGKILDEAGQPVAGALVTVSFLATDDKLLSDESPEISEVKKLEATTDGEGVFTLKKTWINLPGLKSKFYGAMVKMSAPEKRSKTVQIINMRVMGGAIGVFLIGLIDAQGDDFDTPVVDTVAHAYKTVKESKFSRVYIKALTQDAFVLKAGDPQDTDEAPEVDPFDK